MRNVSFAAALVASLGTAALAGSGAKVPFSHEVHVGNFKEPCLTCHEVPGTGMPLLNKDACVQCHEQAPKFTFTKAPRLGLDFPHPAHTRSLDCLECHGSISAPRATPGEPLVARAECAGCHSRRGLKTAERRCAVCHLTDQKKVRPKDHAGNWAEVHGRSAEGRAFDEHGKNCNACHGSDTCVRCHRERMPKDHTGLWRVRLHGSAASLDRDGCKTCHETGTCVRCHQSTRPMNHTASWQTNHGLAAAVTDNENCRVCHTAAQCTGCHRQGL